MKYVVVLGDGMADLPIDELGGKTPLEAANKPNIDELATLSEVGMFKSVPDGMSPGSDVANLSVLGYDPKRYYSGRSPLEAASIGISLRATDVTFRCNLVCLSGEGDYEDLTMEDYSAGEISTAEAKQLIDFLKKYLDDNTFSLFSGVSYRHCLVADNVAKGTILTPPHNISGKPVKNYLPQGGIGDKLLELMKRSRELLKDHPVNINRVMSGKRPANSIWFWGEGTKPKLDGFESKYGLKGAIISAVDLLKGIGILTGMLVIDVDGATGTYKTNFKGKATAALNALKHGVDFVFIHMEAPDECGHQGDVKHKVYSIEQIDEKVVQPLLSGLRQMGDFAMLICPDHPTPISTRTHSSAPVPYLLYKSNRECESSLTTYTEKSAASTGITVSDGYKMMLKLMS